MSNKKEIKTNLTPTIKREMADKDSFSNDLEVEFISIKKTEYELLKTRYGIAKTALESVLCFIVPVNLREVVNKAMGEIDKAGLDINKK